MITIGADPEVFFRDTRTGTVMPVIGLLGGTKDEPRPIEGLGEGFAVQEDNVMAEFNIPPCASAQEFSRGIGQALESVEQLVRTSQPNLVLDFHCSRLFAHGALRSKQARLFGCSPEFNAYENGAACRPVRPLQFEEEDGAWRFAGGHVHLGYEKDKAPPEYVVARFCDVYLGLESLAVDKQGRRREVYGQAGRYRPTDYGIEYRTLSNFWIFDDGMRRNVGHKALWLGVVLSNEANRDMLQSVYQEIPWTDVEAAIAAEDETTAADLLAYINNDLGMGQL